MDNGLNNHLEIGALPELQVIALDDLVYHEETDRSRYAGIVEDLRVGGRLKNPPIVARSRRFEQYILLDGANRIAALNEWGFKHVVVQVIGLDDPLLQLHTWHHAIEQMDRSKIESTLEKMNNVTIAETEPGAELSNDSVCRVTFADNHALQVTQADGLDGRIGVLRDITGLYLKSPYFDRVSYTNIGHLKSNYPDFQALIEFRRFTKDELVQMVEQGLSLPTGVTRVFLPKRALGLNISLDFLRMNENLEQKNKRLRSMIRGRIREKSIRFYREPTFVFNE